MGYLMAVNGQINWFLLCCAWAECLRPGASNAINQVIEKDFDKLMKRTANRPLPTERMTSIEAPINSRYHGCFRYNNSMALF